MRYRIIDAGVASADVVTYRAEDAVTGRPLTLSVLRGPVASDPDAVAALREQASRLAKPACDHRALVRVYDVGTTDEGEPFVALEPVAGRSLRELLEERGAFDPSDALRLAIQVGEGLETLHRSGIVHGELRPEMVVVVTDRDGGDAVKLVGVELLSARRAAAGLRTDDAGVAAYLAPEQIARAETTEACDVHALGLLIGELLTGQGPHGAGGRGAGELPPAIARIVAKALEPGPGRRYSSVSLMVNDMWSVASDSPESPEGPVRAIDVVVERRLSARRRARADVGLAAALVLSLVLVGVTAWVMHTDRLARSVSSAPEPVVAASPRAPAHLAPAAPPPRLAPPSTTSPRPPSPGSAPAPAAAEPVRSERPPLRVQIPAEPSKPVTVGSVVRPAARQREAPAAADQPSTDGGDGTAIIDWLLKGERSGS